MAFSSVEFLGCGTHSSSLRFVETSKNFTGAGSVSKLLLWDLGDCIRDMRVFEGDVVFAFSDSLPIMLSFQSPGDDVPNCMATSSQWDGTLNYYQV